MKLAGLVFLASSAFLFGCASTQTKTFDDGGKVYVGRGGAKEIKDGVEIWSDGSPPRPFKILAVISDERPQAVVPMARFKGMIVERTKTLGGDAAIIRSAGNVDAGTIYMPGTTTTNYQATARPTYGGNYQVSGTASSYSTPGYAVNARRHEAVIDIVKYVEAPPTAAASNVRRDENGITAATYRQLAEKYQREGEPEMAALARSKAAQIEQ